MSTRHSTEKGLFGPFAQNLGAVDYFQHNQQLEMLPPAATVELAVKARPGLEGAGQWMSRSWWEPMNIGDVAPVDGLASEVVGDAREMPVRDDQGSIKGMAGEIGDIPVVDGLASEVMSEGGGEDAGS
ncbi:hypothetical protein [Aeromonas caviae]|uniref:hypothetical protein n=1 Tax=Aeromonas caviae TaxID=648 RepID=UPI0008568D8E|nr:hypothetical protein [Aeromonas caviae]OCW45025.1 hypothetical protein A6763_19400 [Aeromonas caviae]WGY76940.1 hypothetical protein MLL77_07830 [Aeromonas caviae]